MEEANEYRYEGNEGEKIPKSVQKLIVKPGIQVLPVRLCSERRHLREVTLPEGLIQIEESVFFCCASLLEIKICSRVEYIGKFAFQECRKLTKVEFGLPSSSHRHDRLEKIDQLAFFQCLSLQRINIPSSVNKISECVFLNCSALVEAILSTTSIKEVPAQVFCRCRSLQTVSLPITLKHIRTEAFSQCDCLVTVVLIPLDSKPIKIGPEAFYRCKSLANIVLPQRSIAGFMSAPDYRKRDTFDSCTLLQDRFGNDIGYVVDGLVARFDGFPVHKLCYDHSSVTATELGHCIIEDQGEESPLVDQFGMTPFHVLFSTHEPRQDLLQAHLDNYYPYHTGILDCKDANGKRPLDYLLSNWTGISMSLFRISLQKWMVDSMVRWGATSWRNDMQTKVQAILAEGDMVQKANLCNEAYGSLKGYEGMGAMYILEIALWKRKLKDGRSKDGTKRQALDREECRCVCGSNIVVPSVKLFLEIDRNHPDRADSSPHD